MSLISPNNPLEWRLHRHRSRRRCPALTTVVASAHVVGLVASKYVGVDPSAGSELRGRFPNLGSRIPNLVPCRCPDIIRVEETVRTRSLLMMLCLAAWAGERSAAAQSTLAASIGNVFGGDTGSKTDIYALAIGGGGLHGINSELEFADARHFFDDSSSGVKGHVITLMANLQLVIPAGAVRPYGVFGIGFIRQRFEASTGGIFEDLSSKDVGYDLGGGVVYLIGSHFGVRGDLRHFKIRKADGLRFKRFLVGIVLSG